MAKQRRLGRGLDGLLPAAPTKEAARGVGQGFTAPIEELHPNRDQPRSYFDEAALEELSASIVAMGVLEPILVRQRPAGGYEIVAGERRWRAAQKAGLREVPIFVRELSTEAAFEAALVENLQREDLNPVETARAFARLLDEHGHTQDSLAEKVGKDRSTVANAVRLLKLPPAVLTLLEQGQLSEGHGRAVLGAPSAAATSRLAHEAVKKGWSVRETERRVRAEAKPKAEKDSTKGKSANVRDLENRLSRHLGAKVNVEDKKGKGQVMITYTSYDELDRLLEQLLD